ncbi:LytR family transcriptional regulator [Leifsonia xyli subsp. xyli]|uniref:LytR family transcriptional regulator n=1 Tax=Leifsonia xyli subsp. xyli TaxID=59736 RepID=A0A1E2SL93_LEIXY|nr:LytR family transcriptional regulator [Leifsonia xyli subsp. xyli]
MRRPNFSVNDPGADGNEPTTEIVGRVPADQQRDPRRPVRATRPAAETASGRTRAGARTAEFDPFGLGGGGHSGDGGRGGPALPENGGGGSGGDRPPRKRRRAKRILAWTAACLAVLLIVVGGYAAYSYFRFIGGVSHVDVIDKPAHDADGRDQNILLVGDDHRPDGATKAELDQLSTTGDGGGTNTDTMMILHVPADGKSATLISLPRDSWVAVPGHGMNKLNAAFSLGGGASDSAAGAKLLIQTVQNLTGLGIDHYVRVSLLGFYTIAKALGPIEVCLNEAVNDPYSGAKFPAGVSTLDAKQALSFVRQRHGLPRGDLDRVVRQQYFLSVEARKFLSAGTLLNPGKLTKVLDAVSGSIETDPGLDFLQLAAQLQGLTGGKIQSATIPITGTPTITVDGQDLSIVEVDTAAMPAFIQRLMGTPSAYDDAKAAKPAETTVTVLNGGSENGAAASATQTFAAAGFKTGTAGDASTRATTVIQYPKGQESQAKAVAAYLPGATAQETASVSTVTVVLGDDGIMPAAPSTAAPGSPAHATPAPTPSGPATSYSDKVCIN